MPIWCQTGPGPVGAGRAGEVERPAELGVVSRSKAITALTTFGSAASCSSVGRRGQGRHVACRAHPAARGRGRRAAGSSVGRSPCRLTTRSNRRAGSSRLQRRRRCGRCRRAAPDRSAPPRRRPPAPHRRSPARRRPPRPARRSASTARRQTWTIIGSPAIVGERLVGQPGRAQPGRDQDDGTRRYVIAFRRGSRHHIHRPRNDRARHRLAALTPACGVVYRPVAPSARAAPEARRVASERGFVSGWQRLSKATRSSRPS